MLTQRLAEFAVETRPADIPSHVMNGARDALIDTLGCALAGTLEEVSEIATAHVRETASAPRATVWGHGFSVGAADAAFANGISGHALDFDDTHGGFHGHPSTTMLPAAIALAEQFGATGEALLAAHAVGLEVGGKLATAVGDQHYQGGWHNTGTMGVFASTAAAGRIAGLDAGQMRQALAMAASQSSGLLRNFGTMTKPFHAGHAARCAVTAVLLARKGFTADTSIFDRDDSYLATYGRGDGKPLSEVLDRLGSPWEIEVPGICFKRWPCCYCNHRPVGTMQLIMEQHGIRRDEVTGVDIGFPPGSDTALIHQKADTGLEGKFCIQYVAAALLLDGKLTLETFTDVMVRRPEVQALMQKVRRYRIEDKKVYSGSIGYNDVTLHTARGDFSLRVDRTPGSPAWPMSEADHREKFLDCAGRVLGSEGAQRLLDLAVNCATLADVRQLARATQPREAARAATAQGVRV